MDNNNLPANCNQCPNGCPADALKCGKGKAYFERLKNGEAAPAPLPESENGLVRLLTKCGKIAEHKSGKMREHGKDDGAMFQSLSEEERAHLTTILTKLQTTWKAEHEKHHGSHGHHGEHKHELEENAPGRETVLSLGLTMLGLVALGGLGGALCSVFANIACENAGNGMRKDCFSRVINFSIPQVDRFGTGTLDASFRP